MSVNYRVISGAFIRGDQHPQLQSRKPLNTRSLEKASGLYDLQVQRAWSCQPISDMFQMAFEMTDSPTKPRSIVERDSPQFYERISWTDRILMLQAAYEINTLFSISIIPSLPNMLQTLHFMKFPGRDDLTQDLATVTECRTPAMISMGKKVTGFLKPWKKYSSATFTPDLAIERCKRIHLTSIRDIPTDLDAPLLSPLQSSFLRSHCAHQKVSRDLRRRGQHPKPAASDRLSQLKNHRIAPQIPLPAVHWREFHTWHTHQALLFSTPPLPILRGRGPPPRACGRRESLFWYCQSAFGAKAGRLGQSQPGIQKNSPEWIPWIMAKGWMLLRAWENIQG